MKATTPPPPKKCRIFGLHLVLFKQNMILVKVNVCLMRLGRYCVVYCSYWIEIEYHGVINHFSKVCESCQAHLKTQS